MTEQIKNAIYRLIDTRDYKYSHFSFTDDTGKAFDLAIRSLQAWEEVLQELEVAKEHATDLVSPKIFGMKVKELTDVCFDRAIKIINQHLEIEE